MQSKFNCPFCGIVVSHHPDTRCLDAWVEGLTCSYQIIPSEAVPDECRGGNYLSDDSILSPPKETGNFYRYMWEGDYSEPVGFYVSGKMWEETGWLIEQLLASETDFAFGYEDGGFFASYDTGIEYGGGTVVVRFNASSLSLAICRAFVHWKLVNGGVFSNELILGKGED